MIRMFKKVQHDYKEIENASSMGHQLTFTTSLAASSAGTPRQDFAAISEGRASQIPSEAIMSLPPTFDNCSRKCGY